MKMKKIILVSGVVAAGAVGQANATTGGDFSTSAITTSECSLLNAGASVKVVLSTGNLGSYNCNSSTANIGVAVANTAGKNKVFYLGSAGGKLNEVTTASTPTLSNTQSYASSGSSS